jgi:hypothetical protein
VLGWLAGESIKFGPICLYSRFGHVCTGRRGVSKVGIWPQNRWTPPPGHADGTSLHVLLVRHDGNAETSR